MKCTIAIIASIGLLALFLACPQPSQTPDIRVGMHVTNGYCSGWVSDITDNQAKIVDAKCGGVSFNFIFVPLRELTKI